MWDGCGVGRLDGLRDGLKVGGACEGGGVGDESCLDGKGVGTDVGDIDGRLDGFFVGRCDGFSEVG